MPVSELKLRSFRGFAEATLPLSPLTVLLGPNSAGKSCFGHALVGLAQAQRHAGGNAIDLAPPPGATEETWPVDLGSFEELHTTGMKGPVGIEVETEQGRVVMEFGSLERFPLRLSRIEFPSLRAGQAGEAGSVREVTANSLGVSTSATPPTKGGGGHWSESFDRAAADTWRDGEGREVSLSLRGIEITAAVLAHTGSAVEFSADAGRWLSSYLRSVRYLRAIRQGPQRRYRRPESPVDSIGPAGTWTADVLAVHGPDPSPVAEPPAPSSIEQALRVLDAPWTSLPSTLLQSVGYWLRHLQLGTEIEADPVDGGRAVTLNARLRLEGRARPLTDLGFGLSQVIPLLVAGQRLGRDDLLVVELPEAHLHPAPQALLADFFCSIVKRGARLLVETHSESLFHRLRLRAALDLDLAKDIGVWFLDRPNTDTGLCGEPRRVRLDDELHWPVGFLLEGYEDEIALRAARGARKQSGARR